MPPTSALIAYFISQAESDEAATHPAGDAGASTQPSPPPASNEDVGTTIVNLLGDTFTQTSWWGWLGLLGGLFLGLTAGKIVQTFLRSAAGRLESRGWKVRAATLRHTAGPANLALMTLGVAIGLQGIVMKPEVTAVALKIIGFLYIVAIGWLLYNMAELIDFALRRLTAKTAAKLDDAVVTLLRKTLRIFLLIMMVLFVAENIFGADITAWLAGLGIAGLAISLAAQDSVKNLFGSVTILMEHPFGVGDRIVFEGIEGVVEAIGFRSTKIRNFNGHLLTVPNMKFTDGVVENISARPWGRRTMNITVTYDTPPDKLDEAIRIIKDILAEPEIAKDLAVPDRPARVFFNEFNADSLNIGVTYFYLLNVDGRDWWTFQALAAEVNRRILRAFEQAGIQFAFPTRTVYLAGDPSRELAVRVLGSRDERNDV